MVHVKFYGRRSAWAQHRDDLSEIVQLTLVGAFEIPFKERVHRFCWLDDDDLIAARPDNYLIIEVLCAADRCLAERRGLIRALYMALEFQLGLDPEALEIIIIESPRANWGIQGVVADEVESHRISA